jgi:hypothetical protein
MDNGEKFLMMPLLELDADQAVQDVLNAWGAFRTSRPEPVHLSESFTDLFEKMQAYRTAKSIADNRRDHHMLTQEHAMEEKRTKKEFLDAYHVFYETWQ